MFDATVLTEAQAVLDFWFGELDASQRFARDDVIDTAIAARFGVLHAELSGKIPEAWQTGPRSLLAAVIVLDQFSRNLYRDDARAFAQDEVARALTEDALAKQWDHTLDSDEKQFLYMPLMHSEVLADVERSRALMHIAGHQAGEVFAKRHAATIASFGRYPARNAALDRPSTDKELAFLKDNPAGF